MRSLNFPNLINGGWKELEFKPFRPGVSIHYLVKGEEGAPTVALLQYEPGASVPLHRHTGLETIIVLEGEESDENGSYPKGAVAINEIGTQHSVWSDHGAVVLIQWNAPVEFLST